MTHPAAQWTLTNADCIAAMRAMPDKAYDLAIVDPPYGLGMAMGHKGSVARGDANKYAAFHGNDSEAPPQLYFEELMRVSKNQIIWGGNYFDLPPTKCYIVWDKEQPEVFTLAMCEFAWSSFDEPAKIYRQRVVGAGPRFHPTQKPVALYKWLLKNYAKPNDKILDTHGGSCSSVIAAIDMGFSIDAYELDPDYYAMALKRIQTHELQPRLIPNTPPTTEQTTLL